MPTEFKLRFIFISLQGLNNMLLSSTILNNLFPFECD
uniref:Uncharacterized protein n=1 Tax=Siphoviridae sp. ctrpg19 TaxID=2826481 RepID=A0A8S5MK28_9CAUD|nr:MAG TPA: hypothetical protein [Siphoviridae sp. ctrpg19]